jgi:alpha-L-fucosidase
MFERFENGGTREIKQFYEQLDQRVYTIEHIMPQHLRQEWIDALGKDAAKIHEEWLHRLANLTLTAYNPELSDRPFAEKRDTEEYGYKNSGLRMNQKIAQKEAWGLAELEERNREMIQKADEIWACP